MDKLRSMQVFCEVVRRGSFSGAAESLQLVNSAVSRQVSELEQLLGVQLLYRTTRSLGLTEEGKHYLHRFESVLADVEELEQQAGAHRHEAVGTLRITTFPFLAHYLVKPILPQFLAENPKVRIFMMLTERLVALAEEGFDLAIRVGVLPDSTLIARQIGIVEMRTVASPAYLDEHGAPKTPDDLRDHNCLYDAILDRHNQRWTYQVDGKYVTVPVEGNLVVNGGEMILEMVCADLGIGYLPNFFVDRAIVNNELVEVLGEYGYASFPLSLVFPHNRRMSRALRLLTDLLVEYYESSPQ